MPETSFASLITSAKGFCACAAAAAPAAAPAAAATGAGVGRAAPGAVGCGVVAPGCVAATAAAAAMAAVSAVFAVSDDAVSGVVAHPAMRSGMVAALTANARHRANVFMTRTLGSECPEVTLSRQ